MQEMDYKYMMSFLLSLFRKAMFEQNISFELNDKKIKKYLALVEIARNECMFEKFINEKYSFIEKVYEEYKELASKEETESGKDWYWNIFDNKTLIIMKSIIENYLQN